MDDCIFCKMFTGEVESRKVYESKDVLGVLDIQPRFARGQCVVIPRKHVAQFYKLEDEELSELFKGVKVVAQKIKKAFDIEIVGLFSRGTSVPIHTHVIVYPATGEGPVDIIFAGFRAIRELQNTSTSELDGIAERIWRS